MTARERTTIIVEAALSVALAAVLGQLKLWEMPQGGSISLGMLPLIVFALRRGLGPGLAAGLVYGLVDTMFNPIVVHPVQYVLDYPMPWMLLGLAGFASRPYRSSSARRDHVTGTAWALAGMIVGTLGRYVSHLVSGAVFFGEYAPAGQPVWAYSAIYNLYVPISALACAAAALVLLPALERALPASRGSRA